MRRAASSIRIHPARITAGVKSLRCTGCTRRSRSTSWSASNQQGSGFYHSERSYGSFYRSIPLPEGVDPQTVDANFKNGVLDVCFDAPCATQQQSRQIEIREGSAQASGTAASGKR